MDGVALHLEVQRLQDPDHFLTGNIGAQQAVDLLRLQLHGDGVGVLGDDVHHALHHLAGAFAAGGFGSITSHSWANQRMSLAQTQQHMEQAGVEFTLPECIGDFAFSYGYDADTLAESAAGEREQVKEVNAEYEKDGVTLDFSAHTAYTVFDGEDDPYAPDVERDVNGVTLAFRDTAYLFVPPDYQPTDEEKQQERAGELAISYGSDQVENTQFQSVSWTQDGVEYSLSGFDTGLDSEEMLSMAAELVK